MDENINSGLHISLQVPGNSYSARYCGPNGDTTRLPADSSSNSLGRSFAFVDVLCQTKESDTEIPCQDVKTLGKQDSDNGTGFGRTPIDGKPHIFNSKKEDQKITKKKERKTKRKEKNTSKKNYRESIHVRGVNSQRKGDNNAKQKDDNPQQQADSRIKSIKDTSIAMVSFECCPNNRTIRELSPSLGELFRIGTLAGTTWTTEDPTTSCRYVLPHIMHEKNHLSKSIDNQAPMHQVSKGSRPYESHANCKNSLMVIEKIKNKYNVRRIATLTQLKLLNEESDFTDDIKSVKKFGFNHIIIIGERDYGMLFLDCYGRMFDWDSMSLVLWPIGNYLDVVAGNSKTSQMIWDVEFDGTVFEFEYGEWYV
ncbi:hypothetical protein C1645_837434 [Glomus cerebriforme]|uniref:Uncharacterized protein n=1 Tax=Glomus cerebriforme TaxID=658196 RepID=A0A397S6P0_9GLOM|nr:hypothetical protein C1645_837434 [Glomus cerebriforme]